MKIEILYPELCNLYGDLMNAEYLARSCGAQVIKTSLKEKPAFISDKVELVYLGGTTERGQEIVRDILGQHLPAIEKRTEEGGVTLVTGNALEIFGKSIEDEKGRKVDMLGMFPIESRRDMMHRYNSLYLGKLEGMDIVGFKSQFGHSYGDCHGLFETVRGAGLNPNVKSEGLRRGNFMATYVLGPLIVLNPPFAKYLLRIMGVERPELKFEDAAMDVYNTRVEEFSDPNRGFIY